MKPSPEAASISQFTASRIWRPTLPPGIVLGCTLEREDARDALILAPPASQDRSCRSVCRLPPEPFVGTSSVRRQAQLLHQRPDIRITTLRGNVQTRLGKLTDGACVASLLAVAGLKRLGLPIAQIWRSTPSRWCRPQGRASSASPCDRTTAGCATCSPRSTTPALAAATAERAMLLQLDGSCRTPIGGYARILPDGALHLTGLVARPDGSFVLKRSLQGAAADADKIGRELGDSLRADSPRDVFD